MYPIFVLDEVYGAYAILVCIQFLYCLMCMGRMLFFMYPIFILFDVFGRMLFPYFSNFYTLMMCMGRMLFSYVSNFYTR